VLSGGAAASSEGTEPSTQQLTEPKVTQTAGTDLAVNAPDAAFDTFLNRLMRAESNGISHAKNPRSSALGPFQFINSTFLAVMRQHFADEVARLSEREILALRTRHDVARRAAKAFSKDNMAYLMERGITPTFGHLRLAFLLGAEGAARVLKEPPGRSVAQVLEGGVIAANPFMRGMSAADLIARATRDVSPRPGEPGGPSKTIVAEATPPPAVVPPAPVPAAKPEAQLPEQSARVAEAGVASALVKPAESETAKAPAPAESKPASEAEAQPTPKPADAKVAEAKAPETVATVPEATAAEAKGTEGKAEAKPAEPETKAAPGPGRIAARRLDRPMVINVTCDERLASCRRWINHEVAKLIVAEN
jgi:hypothetical protein